MNFKVGDKVKVREDLVCGIEYGGNYNVVNDMLEYSGKIMTISQITKYGYHLLEDGNFRYWSDEMLEQCIKNGIVAIKHINTDGVISNNITYNFISSIPVMVGDYVLCETQFGLALGVVTDCNSDYPATKYIISKVDLSSYQEILNKENKKKELKDKMDKIYKEADTLHPLNPLYYLYANINDEMAELIKEYEELG